MCNCFREQGVRSRGADLESVCDYRKTGGIERNLIQSQSFPALVLFKIAAVKFTQWPKNTVTQVKEHRNTATHN